LGLPSAKRTIPILDAAMGYEPHTTAKNPELNARETLKFNNDWSLKQVNVMPAPPSKREKMGQCIYHIRHAGMV